MLPPNETDTYYYYNYITSLSEVHNYENKYAPGSVIVLSPIAHSVLLTNSDNIVTFTYNHAFGQPMKNLGVKLTNLTTGDIDQLYKRYSVDFADGANGSFTIPSGSLSDGTYKIDISAMPDGGLKYFDADDPVWTTGTSVEYIVKTRADVSGDITCDGKPVPTITWSSSGQSVYQVRFGDYDSGAKIGTASSYTVPMVFTDGNYAAQVRTANSFGEWGSWTDIDYVSVTNIPISGNILLSVEKFGNNILLSWLTTVSDPDNYAVFRDGKMIAVVYDTSYMDIYGNGDVEYQVLAMKNKYYAASNVVMFSAILPWDVISYDGGVTYQLLKYTPATKTQNENINTEVTYAYYAGRAKPISVSSNQKTRIKNFTYIFKNRSNATEIIAKEGTPALIKTTRGAIIYGIVHEMNLTDSKYPIVSFSIREIDREGERVEYPV